MEVTHCGRQRGRQGELFDLAVELIPACELIVEQREILPIDKSVFRCERGVG